MGNVHPNISPRGLSQKDLVDILYMIVHSIKTLCAQLSADATVNDSTFTALCYTAGFTVSITDSKGNVTGNTGNETQFITPYGVSDKALLQVMWEITNAFETITEQLDDAAVSETDYEELCYEAIFLHLIENSVGTTVGNGTVYKFRPGGVTDQKQLVEWIYNALNALETFTEKLDADGWTDSTYEALCFTATILLRVENAAGDRIGVTKSIN
jgi:hypothetical protein